MLIWNTTINITYGNVVILWTHMWMIPVVCQSLLWKFKNTGTTLTFKINYKVHRFIHHTIMDAENLEEWIISSYCTVAEAYSEICILEYFTFSQSPEQLSNIPLIIDNTVRNIGKYLVHDENVQSKCILSFIGCIWFIYPSSGA